MSLMVHMAPMIPTAQIAVIFPRAFPIDLDRANETRDFYGVNGPNGSYGSARSNGFHCARTGAIRATPPTAR